MAILELGQSIGSAHGRMDELYQLAAGKVFPARAPAKINLRLKIVGRRNDGYHLLSMINCSVELADELVLRFETERVVTCRTVWRDGIAPIEVGDETNLVCRAFHAFFRTVEVDPPVGMRAELHKRIPAGGGLGGGSSDAAAVLRILAALWRRSGRELSSIDLLKMAAALGADVAYALTGGLAVVTGTGEVVRPLKVANGPALPVLLFLPPIQVATPHAYSLVRREFPVIERVVDVAVDDFLERIAGPSESTLFDELYRIRANDFEGPVAHEFPIIGELLSGMAGIPDCVGGMTGSGAVLYLVGKDALALQSKSVQTFRTFAESLGARIVSSSLAV